MQKAADAIRGAAKWFIGAFGAMGLAVIGALALGDVGKLEGWDLFLALLGIAIAFVGILAAALAVAHLLLPVARDLSELAEASQDDAAIKRLKRASNLLNPYASVQELYTARTDALAKYRRAYKEWDKRKNATTTRAVKAAEIRCAPIEEVAARVISWANYETIQARFRKALWAFMVPGIALAIVGVGLFALFLTDVPSPSPATLNEVDLRGGKLGNSDLSGVSFRDADLTNTDFTGADLGDAVLSNATLDGANFTAANLEGADLDGASLRRARWGQTTCPDGRNSDEVGGTCTAHLRSEEST